MNVGQAIAIVIIQDAGGTNVLTTNAGYLWEGGTEPTWSVGANEVDVINVIRTAAGYMASAILNMS